MYVSQFLSKFVEEEYDLDKKPTKYNMRRALYFFFWINKNL